MVTFQYESVSQFSAARSQPKQFSKSFSVKSIIYLLVLLSRLFMVAIYRKQRDIQSVARSYSDIEAYIIRGMMY